MGDFWQRTKKFWLTDINKDNPEKPSMKIVWAIMYFALTVCVLVASCFIFNKVYYTFFYVEGYSMSPTLNYNMKPGYHDFGIVDSHRSIFNTLKRYDIVITYYPDDIKNDEGDIKEYATSKIKRVIGMPNEKVTISNKQGLRPDGTSGKYNEIVVSTPISLNGETTYKDETLYLPFFDKITPDMQFNWAGISPAINEMGGDGSYTWTLNDNEYFVMGDNWGHSTDSTAKHVGAIEREYMTGVLIAINGQCQITGSGENARAINKVFSGPTYYKR